MLPSFVFDEVSLTFGEFDENQAQSFRKIDVKSDLSRKSAMIAVEIAEQAEEATEAVLNEVEEIVGAIENDESDPEFVVPDEFIENETSGQVDQNDDVIVISSGDESETSSGLWDRCYHFTTWFSETCDRVVES